MTKPEPSEWTCGRCAPCRPRLLKVSPNWSNGEPGGNSGLSAESLSPLSAGAWVVEILTTDGPSACARSPKLSGSECICADAGSATATTQQIANHLGAARRQARGTTAGTVKAAWQASTAILLDAREYRTAPTRQSLQICLRRGIDHR